MCLRTWLFHHFREVSRLMTFEKGDFPVLESEALFIQKGSEEITQQVRSSLMSLEIISNSEPLF
jgi:histidyl-tRNA synthetase